MHSLANHRVILPRGGVGILGGALDAIGSGCGAIDLLALGHDVVQPARLGAGHRVLCGAGALTHEAGVEHGCSHFLYWPSYCDMQPEARDAHRISR